jgi:RNA polymerase sigma-70 factor (ECF subfamily)
LKAAGAIDRDVHRDPADAERFRDMYRAEAGYVLRSLRRLGASAADAEDLAHDVFVVAFRKLAEFDVTRPLKPWLFGIAYRVAAGHRRLARHGAEVPIGHHDAPGGAALPDEQAAASERRELVLRALARRELPQRAVVVLHDLEGRAVPEIAATLDVNVNTVYSRLRLGREKFAAAVRELSNREAA